MHGRPAGAVRAGDAEWRLRAAALRERHPLVYAEIEGQGYADGDRDGFERGIAVGVERGRQEERDRLGLGPDREPQRPREAAVEWLCELLRDGPRKAAEIKACAARDGHAWRTVERAKADVGAVARPGHVGGARASWWKLPGQAFPWE